MRLFTSSLAVVGELQLQPGDAIFGRSILANGDPEEDAMSALGGVMYAFIFSRVHILNSLRCWFLQDYKRLSKAV